MRINVAIKRLKNRISYLESLLLKEDTKGIFHVNADIAANKIAIKCMELMSSYGYVGIANYDEEFGGPLIRGQSGIPKPFPEVSKRNPRLKKGTEQAWMQE